MAPHGGACEDTHSQYAAAPGATSLPLGRRRLCSGGASAGRLGSGCSPLGRGLRG
eukprot:gene10125-biopygen6258